MKILILLLLTLSQVAYADTVPVSVDVRIKNKTDFETRQFAKLKAKEAALDNIPLIVSGIETLDGTQYTNSIRAIGLAHVNVHPISEEWDRQNDTYHLVANVSLNENVTRSLVQEVVDNQSLQKELSNAYTQIDELIKGSKASSLESTERNMINISRSILVRGTIEESNAAREKHLSLLIHLFREYQLKRLLNELSIEITDVDKKYIDLKIVKSNKFDTYKQQAESVLRDEVLDYRVKQLPGICLTTNNSVLKQVISVKRRGTSDKFLSIQEASARLSVKHGNNDALLKNLNTHVSFKICTIE